MRTPITISADEYYAATAALCEALGIDSTKVQTVTLQPFNFSAHGTVGTDVYDVTGFVARSAATVIETPFPSAEFAPPVTPLTVANAEPVTEPNATVVNIPDGSGTPETATVQAPVIEQKTTTKARTAGRSNDVRPGDVPPAV